MARLFHKLSTGEFVVTVEIDPPRGADLTGTLKKVRKFADRVDAVNVADCPMANVRMSPIAVAHLIQRDANVEAVFHLTCRDRNVIGLQAELLGAAGLGVRNILALRGDTPERGDHPSAKGVFEVDTVGLIAIAAGLNAGRTLSGRELRTESQIAIGCAANPVAEDLEAEVVRLEHKQEAGAHFVQTQPIFEIGQFQRWVGKVEGRIRIPILYGVLPLRDYEFAVHLNRDVPGFRIPPSVMDRLRRGGPGEGVAIAAELAAEIAQDAAGIHIFPMNNSDRVVALLDELGSRLGTQKGASGYGGW